GRDGAVLEQQPGRKRVALRPTPGGGTVEELIAPYLVKQPCLDSVRLLALNGLAARCEEVYGPGRDIEWAFDGDTLYLLQCRAVTTGKHQDAEPATGASES